MPGSPADQTIRIQLSARCPFLYVVTWEEDRVIARIREMASHLFEAVYS